MHQLECILSSLEMTMLTENHYKPISLESVVICRLFNVAEAEILNFYKFLSCFDYWARI